MRLRTAVRRAVLGHLNVPLQVAKFLITPMPRRIFNAVLDLSEPNLLKGNKNGNVSARLTYNM